MPPLSESSADGNFPLIVQAGLEIVMLLFFCLQRFVGLLFGLVLGTFVVASRMPDLAALAGKNIRFQ